MFEKPLFTMLYRRFKFNPLGENITAISLKVHTTKYWGIAYKRNIPEKSRLYVTSAVFSIRLNRLGYF